jgi:predicted DsbA family dithiol-disulfide isomerase
MSEASPETGLVVNLVADFVCPWCLIGSTRLDQAIEELRTSTPLPELRIVHQPFLLDPAAPKEGRNLRNHLRAKYGADPETMFGRVESAAKESGIPLDFSKIETFPSTVKAHTLVQHALDLGSAEVQRAFVKDLYAAYFFEGRDIGDDDVLLAIAEKHGLPRDQAAALLVDDGELAETHEEARAAQEQGITGVPFFVFDGRFAVSGAQSVPVLVEALRRALPTKA